MIMVGGETFGGLWVASVWCNETHTVPCFICNWHESHSGDWFWNFVCCEVDKIKLRNWQAFELGVESAWIPHVSKEMNVLITSSYVWWKNRDLVDGVLIKEGLLQRNVVRDTSWTFLSGSKLHFDFNLKTVKSFFRYFWKPFDVRRVLPSLLSWLSRTILLKAVPYGMVRNVFHVYSHIAEWEYSV